MTSFLPQSAHFVLERHRYSLLMAAIPVVLFSLVFLLTGLSAKTKPRVEQATYLDRVHKGDSFQDRYGTPLRQDVRVRTIPIVRELEKIEPVLEPQPPPQQEQVVRVWRSEERPRRAETRHRITRSASLDLCQRHNMRKVMVSKHRWRCRR